MRTLVGPTCVIATDGLEISLAQTSAADVVSAVSMTANTRPSAPLNPTPSFERAPLSMANGEPSVAPLAVQYCAHTTPLVAKGFSACVHTTTKYFPSNTTLLAQANSSMGPTETGNSSLAKVPSGCTIRPCRFQSAFSSAFWCHTAIKWPSP